MQAADKVTASYMVDKASAVKVTLRLSLSAGTVDEVYTVVDGIVSGTLAVITDSPVEAKHAHNVRWNDGV